MKCIFCTACGQMTKDTTLWGWLSLYKTNSKMWSTLLAIMCSRGQVSVKSSVVFFRSLKACHSFSALGSFRILQSRKKWSDEWWRKKVLLSSITLFTFYVWIFKAMCMLCIDYIRFNRIEYKKKRSLIVSETLRRCTCSGSPSARCWSSRCPGRPTGGRSSPRRFRWPSYTKSRAWTSERAPSWSSAARGTLPGERGGRIRSNSILPSMQTFDQLVSLT